MWEIEEIERTLFKILEREAKEENFFLLDLKVRGGGMNFKVVVTLDKIGGKITVNDTKKWAERVQNILKVEGIEGSFFIEVSSPGLDRELKTDRELEWAKGKRVSVYLDTGENIKGHLLDFDENLFYILIADNLKKLERQKVAKIKLQELEE